MDLEKIYNINKIRKNIDINLALSITIYTIVKVKEKLSWLELKI